MKFVFFLKSRLILKIFYCLCMFVKKLFISMGAHVSKSKRCYIAKPSAYYLTKIPLNFGICISVPEIVFYLCRTNENMKLETI